AAPPGRAALGRLAPPDLTDPIGTELRCAWVGPEVVGLEHADLSAPEPPPIGDLEHGGVPEGRRPALLRPGPDGLDVVVGGVEQCLELHPGQRPALGATFVLRSVGRQVLRTTDLARSR